MICYTLNDTEDAKLKKWLNTRKVKNALLKHGKLALTFGETGIGTHIQADIMLDGQSLMSIDVTDYESW